MWHEAFENCHHAHTCRINCNDVAWAWFIGFTRTVCRIGQHMVRLPLSHIKLVICHDCIPRTPGVSACRHRGTTTRSNSAGSLMALKTAMFRPQLQSSIDLNTVFVRLW